MKKYLSYFFLFFSFSVTAQNPLPGYRLAQQRLPACFDELIKCNCIQQLYQDSKGFLWLATPLGLMRFDGYDCKYFRHDPANPKTIANNFVYKITEDKEGNIWTGLNQKGISRYNPVLDEFTNYHVSSNDSSNETAVESIFADENNEIWFSIGYSGLGHLNKKTKTTDIYKIVTTQNCPHLKESTAHYSNYAMDIKMRDANSLWLGTPEGLFIFDKTKKTCIPVRSKPVDTSKPADYNARRIIKDGDVLWIGGWSSGMQSYNTKTGRWEQYLFSKAGKGIYTDNIIIDMADKDADEIWVASSDKGLGIFNKKRKTTLFFRGNDGYNYFPETYSNLVFVDRQRNLWTMYEDAFYKFNIEPEQIEAFKINTYKNQNNGTGVTNEVLEDPTGRFLIVGTSYSDGIVFVDQKLKDTFNIAVPTKREKVMHVMGLVQKDDESIWVLTSEYLLTLNLYTHQVSKPIQPEGKKIEWGTDIYSSVVMDEDKNLWIQSPMNGIIFYDTQTGISKKYSTESKDAATTIATNTISCIAYDKHGRLWYGSRLSACYGYYDTKTKTNVVLDENGNITDKAHSVKCYNFVNIDGIMYACTSAGLLELEFSGSRIVLKSKINSSNGIGADWVRSAAKDRNGDWWLISLFGLCRYNPGTGSLQILDKSNGVHNDVQAISITAKKNLYLLGANYYYKIIENTRPVAPKPFTPVITALKINESESNVNRMLNETNEVTIPANYKYFSFFYASLDFDHADRTNYYYMLEGYDKDWVQAGDRRFANYTNLPGGDYIFKVRSSFENESKFSSVTTVPVFIGTLFYNTIWFRALIVGAIALVLYSIYRYRINKQNEINKLNNQAQLLEREKTLVQYENLKQQLNPHFLFNSLAALSSLISSDPAVARTYLDQMSKIYRYILKNSNNELVPLSDEITFANTYINLQKTRFENGLEVNIHVDEEYDYRKIVPVTIQNMIENAIKHNIIRAGSPLVIDIMVENDYLVVKNNLQKKLMVETSNKHGLNQLRALYHYLSENPIIIDETDKYFAIKIPLV